MENLIVVLMLILLIGVAIVYIIRAKKSGVKCIGCPAGGNCPGKSAGNSEYCCGCHLDIEEV